jgi:hypothetical protein
MNTMSSNKKPTWRITFLVGFVGVGALFVEPQLPLGATTHTLLLLAWVMVFYGALAIWVKANREALEREPQPRDCVGRSIIDVDAPEREAKARPKPENPAVQLPVVHPLSQSEVI